MRDWKGNCLPRQHLHHLLSRAVLSRRAWKLSWYSKSCSSIASQILCEQELIRTNGTGFSSNLLSNVTCSTRKWEKVLSYLERSCNLMCFFLFLTPVLSHECIPLYSLIYLSLPVNLFFPLLFSQQQGLVVFKYLSLSLSFSFSLSHL